MARPDFSKMRPAMRPIAIPEMPGCSAWASFAALREATQATGVHNAGTLLADLLNGNPKVIEECTSRFIIHDADASRFTGTVDDVPLAVLPLGRLLARACHARILGEDLDAPLIVEGDADV